MTDLERDLMENEPAPERPPLSKWDHVADCCCCGPLVRVREPTGNRHFIRYWDCQPLMPILVTCLALYPAIVHFAFVMWRSPVYLNLISAVLVLALMVLFGWSYFGATFMDPGFLPFNWIDTKQFWYSWEDQLAGLAITDEQIAFARDPKNKPPGCSFSVSSRRYIIRADHMCGWIANWVGKRNHKQFLLMNFWGAAYAAALFGFACGQNDAPWNYDQATAMVEIAAMMIECVFGVTMLVMGIATLIDLTGHRTKLQRMRNDRYVSVDMTCGQAMQEVCGTGHKCLWLCPTRAFDETLTMFVTTDA